MVEFLLLKQERLEQLLFKEQFWIVILLYDSLLVRFWCNLHALLYGHTLLINPMLFWEFWVLLIMSTLILKYWILSDAETNNKAVLTGWRASQSEKSLKHFSSTYTHCNIGSSLVHVLIFLILQMHVTWVGQGGSSSHQSSGRYIIVYSIKMVNFCSMISISKTAIIMLLEYW